MDLLPGPLAYAALNVPGVQFSLQEGNPVGVGTPKKVDPREFRWNATLAELSVGSATNVTWQHVHTCPRCLGHGAEAPHWSECSRCNGTGSLAHSDGFGACTMRAGDGSGECMEWSVRQDVTRNCPTCGGFGTVPDPAHLCAECDGDRFTADGFTTGVLEVPPGADQDHRITFHGLGDEGPLQDRGDAVFVVDALPDPFFTRQADNLLCTVNVTLAEALTGFYRTLQHPNGTNIHLNVTDTVTVHGAELVVFRAGMPRLHTRGQYGDLNVTVSVNFPLALDHGARMLLADLFGRSRESVKRFGAPEQEAAEADGEDIEELTIDDDDDDDDDS